MEAPAASPAPPRHFKLILVLLSIGMALVFAEVALRIAVPPRKHFRVWPANMFHVFHPDPQVMPGFSTDARFTVSSQGLRGPEMGDEPEARVLAIGGSTTECLMIDDELAWPLRLSKNLGATADNRPVWSGSSGLSGMNSGDHILHASFLVPQLPPIDVVVALVGVNDLSVALGTPELYKPVPANPPPEQSEALLRRVFQQVPGRLENSWEYDESFYRKLALFQLVRRLKNARSKDLSSQQLTNDDGGSLLTRGRRRRQNAPHYIDELPDLSAALVTYRTNLNTFIDVLQARSIRVLLVTQPTIWRADLSEADTKLLWMGGKGDFLKLDGMPYYTPRVLADGMKQFNDTMLAVCRDRGVECFDLAARIPKDTTFFYDDCHFANGGSVQIAELLTEPLKAGRPFAK